ncbi:MAG: protein-glutamate O-methyltransferase CheR [Anaerolineaceae bacterium]
MDAETFAQVKSSVKKILNIDLNYYKEEQVKRRLDSWLLRNNMPDWKIYFDKVTSNATEMSRFRDFLTINVTEFYRDTHHWKTLEEKVLPLLCKQANERKSSLKLWSAGCSVGVEAYTLTMAMDKVASHTPYEIFASDMDRGALQKAKARGPYAAEEVRNLLPDQKNKYLEEIAGKYYFKEQFTHSIRFFEQDLLMDEFTGGFDLIVCRNVVIYFTREAKDMLYMKFRNALNPGGILFVGGTELIPRPSEYGFTSQWMSFYSKI